MLSFYDKLASKLNEAGTATPSNPPAGGSGARSVSFKATGERTDPSQGQNAQDQAPGVPPNDPAPEGTDPLDIDLFQSEGRMVVFAQMAGVSKDDFEITIEEESNTLTIRAEQKHPPLPPPAGAKEGDAPEKGRYVKQETKWKKLYRKVYLPGPFDAGAAEAFLDRGVLVIVLPSKRPGEGKKLTVKEISDETRENQPEK